jgi:EmrB/QacA subfamily drug resistance transporter
MQVSPMQRPKAAPVQERNPWLVLIIICTAVFMLLLDTTIVNNAQVKIRVGLDANLTQIQWVLDSYILAYAVLLLSFGRLGDIFGRKRLFVLGMSIFTAASGLCAMSAWIGDGINVSGVNVLIIARVLQGIGGAFMMPQSLTLVTVVFPPEKRGAALGIWGSVVGLGAIMGPVIGGTIVTNYAWEWVFLINIPVGIAAVWATLRIVPESVDPLASKQIDWLGLGLSSVGIFAVIYAMIEGNAKGWTSPLIVGSTLFGAILLVLFVLWERRVTDPMMKLELFRIRNFWIGNVMAVAISFGMLGIFFPMTIFLQGVLGFSPIRAGLTMTPMSVMLMVAAPLAGRLTDRVGPRWIMVSGASLMFAGILYLITQVNLQTDWLQLLPALVVTGIGMGLTFSPMTAAAMRDVPPRIAGSASGIINTMRNIGQVLGIAVLGSYLQHRVGVSVGDKVDSFALDPATKDRVVELSQQSQFDKIGGVVGQDQLDAIFLAIQKGFVDALHSTFIIGAFMCLLAAVIATQVRNPKPQTASKRAPAPSETAVAAALNAD